ncbi:hypothetical protein BGX31_001457 [Mortierella sp. GBA43]|nr:hypothetical protein BGX31_001457 [Mortierella sp. GBA43]
MDSRAGPWPANSSYFHLLKTFAVNYVRDLIGLFCGSRGGTPSILPIYSTVLPSYILNLLFEIIQTWIFRWLYPKMVPSNLFTRNKSKAAISPPPHLLTPMPLAPSNGIGASTAANVGLSSTSQRSGQAQAHQHQQQQQQQQQRLARQSARGSVVAVTASDISSTLMAAMPTVSQNPPPPITPTVHRARKELRYFSTATPRNPTFLQEFYPEMVCAMTSSMVTRVLLYPFDTIASRVSAQGATFPLIGHVPRPYNGFWDCWIQSVRPSGGGIMGLYSGLVDCIIIEAMMRWVVLEGTWFAHLVVQWFFQR